ncbi:condensin complex subunit 1 isoform X1 [Chenopodium quinoa]|uniref:condensin complex subunit 1 isoform X1 n=1 Tax=Chenopodium quinoa TaxID=63459 RepID=UPI000B78B68A|nr:condensin complex subunit 1 isoform X1 [Chenopodium quinoa]
MAPSFIFPPNLHSLEEENEHNHLSVQNPTNIASLRSSDLEEFVKGVSFDLSDKELFCIEDQDVFDRVYSLVKCFSSLTPPCKLIIVEDLRSNFTVLLPNIDSLSRVSHSPQNDDDDEDGDGEDGSVVHERIASHRNAFKIYTFFLVQIIHAEESSNASCNTSKTAASSRKKLPINAWKWEGQRGRILTLIANSLEINLSMLFGSSDPDENYLSFIAKNAFLLFENPLLLKDSDAKDALCRIIGSCATKYHYLAQISASIIHLLHKYDFVVTAMADAVAGAEKKYVDGSLATSIIREIGRTNPKNFAKDTAGAENIGRYLVELSERLPKLVSTNIGILVPHFGGESYKIRNALVGVLGKLVSKAFKDDEGEVSSKSVRLRTKQAMLEILLERCRDVSAYTRSRVLQVWSELCEEHSVSIGLWNEVATVAAGRLEDKSAIVRKSALNLLIVMLQHNPFGPQLRISSFEATLDKYNNKLSALQPEANEKTDIDGAPSDKDDCNEDGDIDNVNAEPRSDELPSSVTDSYLSQVEEQTVLKDNSVPDVGNVEQTRALVASLEAGLSFSKCLSATMPTLVQLMASSSATDVENTILLLMRCRQFQIDGSEDCLRKMLPLVFSQDKAICEAVENAFITIYITKNSLETAKNLLNLAIDSNIGDLAALEFMISALVFKGDISSGTISALWDFFCFNLPRTTAEQCRGALTVLCMAAKSSSEILGSHLQDIVDIGFGQWAKVDPLLARTACNTLQRLSEEDRKKLLANNGGRIFGTLESLVTGSWLPENIWYSAADKAIGAIYALHPAPDIIAARLVKKSQTSVFNFGDPGPLQHVTENENGTVNGPITVQAGKLSRFLFVISHIAMHQLMFIESCVRKIQKQKAKNERQNVDGSGLTPDASKESGINAELGVAASDDAILDSLADKAEREIISGGSTEKNLLGYCALFLSKLCRNLSLMQKNPELQAAAMLALCRFMITDAAFCEANLRLLFTVVDSTSSEIVRSNCTIALGDLAVRFPNLLEPWTELMYARLRDKSVSVRKNAVLVLSHLILNEMMKVKGYIYEMAVRLEDEDERIANLAKLFFTELAKKGSNPIYNLLPDILGKLSKQNLKTESFCNIMQFLIASIKKDKQMEGLIEKLCNRFNGVTDGSHLECLAYCLSQLNFTDKGMKKLIESFKTYEHALSEDSVMGHFRSIINKGKKFAKPELKSSIDEFEEKLNKFHLEKKEQEVTARNAKAHKDRIDNFESFTVASKAKQENEDASVTEVDGTDDEIIDPSTGPYSNDVTTNTDGLEEVCSTAANEATDTKASAGSFLNDIVTSDANGLEEDCSAITSEPTEAKDSGEEVLSPIVNQRGVSNSRARKSKSKDQKVLSNASVRTRSTRSKQR